MRVFLFSPDQSIGSVLARFLRDAELDVDFCADENTALERVVSGDSQCYVVDCDDPAMAKTLLQTVRSSPHRKNSLLVALGSSQTSVQFGFQSGAQLAVYKPASLDRVAIAVRAVRNLLTRQRRRESERVPTEIPATVRSHSSAITVFIVDLSTRGAAIRSSELLPLRGLFTLHLWLPGTDRPMTAAAEIVWQDTKGRSGIRFVKLSLDDHRLLLKWLQSQPLANIDSRSVSEPLKDS